MYAKEARQSRYIKRVKKPAKAAEGRARSNARQKISASTAGAALNPKRMPQFDLMSICFEDCVFFPCSGLSSCAAAALSPPALPPVMAAWCLASDEVPSYGWPIQSPRMSVRAALPERIHADGLRFVCTWKQFPSAVAIGQVELLVHEGSRGGQPETIPMTRSDQGVWQAQVPPSWFCCLHPSQQQSMPQNTL